MQRKEGETQTQTRRRKNGAEHKHAGGSKKVQESTSRTVQLRRSNAFIRILAIFCVHVLPLPLPLQRLLPFFILHQVVRISQTGKNWFV